MPDPRMVQALTLDERMRQFGMDPSAERLNVLPYYSEETGLVAPQWLYEIAKGAVLPGHVAQGGAWTPEQVTDMAMALGGTGGAIGSAPMGAAGSNAIRRAAKDLPMDEASRMARAREMGYTTDAYKAYYPYTGGEVRNFQGDVIGIAPEVEITKMNVSRPAGGPFPDWVMSGRSTAGFFTDSPQYANQFAAPMEGAAILSAKLRMENPAIIDAGGKPAWAAQFADTSGSDKSLITKMKAALDDPSVDGIVLKNTADEGTVYIPKNGAQVRSRFAAFDPAKKDSADLLAMNKNPMLGALLFDYQEPQ